MRNLLFVRAATAAALLAVACGGGVDVPSGTNNSSTNTNAVAALTISPTAVPSLPVGISTTLTATAKNSVNAVLTSAVITWSSSNNAVASVASGVVTGLSVGTAQITASTGGISTSVTVTVVAGGTQAVKSITIGLPSSSLATGATAQASATALDASGAPVAGQSATWSISNTAIATISSTGLITGVAPGSVTITAAIGTVTGTATLTVATAGAPAVETPAALPRVYLNTTAPVAPAAGGQIINVSTSAGFTAALTSAQPGDVIALANGVTFSGNFILPVKSASSTSWIVIRPQDVSGLPPEGSRMTPTIAAAANLPKIVSPSGLGAISTINGSHHFRLVGLEVTSTVDNTGLIRFGDGSATQNNLSQVPHDLIVDRMYIHGTSTTAARRAVILNSASSAIIDSYLEHCAELGSDAQAIFGSNGPGPFKIVNNYLEGSGENVMFGGADPSIPNLVPSDIEIRHNHFYKPVAWIGKYTVKNLLESKNSMRMLVEGNLFENNWQDAQNGSAISIKATNQSGTCTWCTTQDLTFRYNIVRNIGSGLVLSGSDPGVTVHTQRVTITDNLIYNINVAPFIGDSRGMYIGGDPTDFTVAHNTILNPDQYGIFFGGPTSGPPVRLSIRDNIIGGGLYGVKSSGLGSGTASISPFMPLTSFAANAVILSSSTGYPSLNYYPTALAAIGFVNASGGDYHLSSSSSLRGKASDGKDLGADVDAVLSKTAGVIVP